MSVLLQLMGDVACGAAYVTFADYDEPTPDDETQFLCWKLDQLAARQGREHAQLPLLPLSDLKGYVNAHAARRGRPAILAQMIEINRKVR